MAPEIYMYGKLVADVPDETGLHQALDGSPLYVDVSGIEARNGKQLLKVEGPAIGGKRIVGLTHEGKGNSSNSKKGGDGKEPILKVVLHERPIRVSYKDQIWHDSRSMGNNHGGQYIESRRTYYNPRWSIR